jgi:hypothetical protein
MANATSVLDLRDDILERGGEATDGSSVYTARSLEYLVRSLHESWTWRPWLFSIKSVPASVNVVAPITNRLVTITVDGTAADFDAAITPSIAGRKLLVGDSWYRIATHTTGTSGATLESAFQEPTVTAVACTIYQDEYVVTAADFMRPVRVYSVREGNYLRAVGIDDPGIRSQLYEPTQGTPGSFAMLTDTRFILDVYPQRAGRLEVHYQFFPPDLTIGGAEPLWPRWRRWLLADRGTALLMVDKNDDRAGAADQMWRAGLAEMEAEFNASAAATGITRNVEIIV